MTAGVSRPFSLAAAEQAFVEPQAERQAARQETTRHRSRLRPGAQTGRIRMG